MQEHVEALCAASAKEGHDVEDDLIKAQAKET